MIRHKTREEAMKASGYQHRAEDEFIFGVDDEQEIYNHLFDIFTEYPIYCNRSGTPRGKVASIREVLLLRMGRPIADTDKDLSGRLPYWVDKYLSGKMTKFITMQPFADFSDGLIPTKPMRFVPAGMDIKYIPVIVPVGDQVDSYRITFKRIKK